jgi:hypothetical protein
VRSGAARVSGVSYLLGCGSYRWPQWTWSLLALGRYRSSEMGEVNRCQDGSFTSTGEYIFERPVDGAVEREIDTGGNDMVSGNPKVAWKVICGG